MSALRRTDTRARPALTAQEARVSNPDPDELTVTIDGFDGDETTRHAWPVAAWPASDDAMPARGDRCLVVRSEIGRVWVVAGAWSGSAAPRWRRLDPASGWRRSDDDSPIGCARSAVGWVALRGLLTPTGAARGQLLLRVPDGFRPGTVRSFPATVGAGLAARITVRPNGDVVVGAMPASGTTDGVPGRSTASATGRRTEQ